MNRLYRLLGAMLAAGAFGCVHAAQGQVGSSLPADFPVIEDASLVYGDSEMPVFKNKLSGAQIDALASYLSGRK